MSLKIAKEDLALKEGKQQSIEEDCARRIELYRKMMEEEKSQQQEVLFVTKWAYFYSMIIAVIVKIYRICNICQGQSVFVIFQYGSC